VRELRGLVYLSLLTCRRQFWTKKTLAAAVLIGLSCFTAVRWSMLRDPESARQQRIQNRSPRILRDWTPDRLVLMGILASLGETNPVERVQREYKPNRTLRFAEENIMRLFVTFFLPALTMIYAAAALGDEYEERTLVYLLVRPLSLWRIYFAKGAGTLPLAVGSVMLAFGMLCTVAGDPGLEAWNLFWPAILLSAVTYFSLFLFFGAVFPRPLVVSLAYAFFFEVLFGSLPGTIKRLSIAFYCRSMMFDAGSDLGFQPVNFRQFMPVSGETSVIVLAISTCVFLGLGAWLFHRRECRDLT
jgi:hypothetical protein